jgi:hypothetical protein
VPVWNLQRKLSFLIPQILHYNSMKNLKRRLTSFLARLGGPLGIADMRREIENVRQTVVGSARATRESQILLKFAYQQQKAAGGALPGLDDVEFRAYSQNGEDGILWYIFSVIGTTNKKCVEICAGDGVQCNIANLIVNHGWNGLLLDGDEKNVARGKAFYAQHPDTFNQPPSLRSCLDRLPFVEWANETLLPLVKDKTWVEI